MLKKVTNRLGIQWCESVIEVVRCKSPAMECVSFFLFFFVERGRIRRRMWSRGNESREASKKNPTTKVVENKFLGVFRTRLHGKREQIMKAPVSF